jgi:hypothetical protein
MLHPIFDPLEAPKRRLLQAKSRGAGFVQAI